MLLPLQSRLLPRARVAQSQYLNNHPRMDQRLKRSSKFIFLPSLESAES